MSVPGPLLGPCESWIDGDYLVETSCCDELTGSGSSAELIDLMAFEASMALFEISGRRFTGLCTRIVRPCRTGATCWDTLPLGSGGGWYWTGAPMVWGWRNDDWQRPLCGCSPLAEIRLAGYPVREIVQIKIGGVELDPLDSNGNPNYRLDRWDTLVRMDDPVTGARRLWPACQNLALDSDQAGTFEVTYRHGVDPPELGRRAAAELACQLLAACPDSASGEDCNIPEGVIEVQRQGITIRRELLAGLFDPSRPSGMVSVDLFLRAYGGTPGTRPPAVWSPDVAPFAPKLG